MSVTVEREGDLLAVVTLDAPPLNLFDEAMFAGLEEAVGRLEGDLPRAVLVRAAGKVVSAGVDVHLFDAVGGSLERAEEINGRFIQLTQRIEALPVPTVFAAHGLCLTAAFEIALGCDLLLAAESARFGLVERVVGLTPTMGGTQRLVERAGPARAREVVYTGELFPAARLEAWNVVNRVLPDEGFAKAALEFVRAIAIGPTRAHAVTKAVVRAALEGGVEKADPFITRAGAELFATEDLQSAVKSFLAEGPGKAKFSGR